MVYDNGGTENEQSEGVKIYLQRTNAPIGAWKRNFPPSKEIMADRPTNRQKLRFQ